MIKYLFFIASLIPALAYAQSNSIEVNPLFLSPAIPDPVEIHAAPIEIESLRLKQPVILTPPETSYAPIPLVENPIAQNITTEIRPIAGTSEMEVSHIDDEEPIERTTIEQEDLPEDVHIFPPLPPRRPSTFMASKALLQDIKNNQLAASSVEETVAFPGYAYVKSPDVENVIQIRDVQPHDIAIASPSVEEVLAQITPAAGNKLETKPVKNKAVRISAKRLPHTNKNLMSLSFLPGESELLNIYADDLIGQILARAHAQPNIRIQLHAYAGNNGQDNNALRRLSLNRALKVRDLLIRNQIDSERITVKALGNQTDKQPFDRVDVLFIDISG